MNNAVGFGIGHDVGFGHWTGDKDMEDWESLIDILGPSASLYIYLPEDLCEI